MPRPFANGLPGVITKRTLAKTGRKGKITTIEAMQAKKQASPAVGGKSYHSSLTPRKEEGKKLITVILIVLHVNDFIFTEASIALPATIRKEATKAPSTKTEMMEPTTNEVLRLLPPPFLRAGR